MKTYIVCYDIEDDRERRRVARCLERYGDRVQKSVFEVCFFDHRDRMAEMLEELKQYIEDESAVRFYRLTKNGYADSRLLDGTPITPPSSSIIIF